MLKKLSFALVAVSFTVPVVACLDKVTDKGASSDANMLTDAEKAACNFGFDAVTPAADEPAIATQQDRGIVSSGRPFLFGDMNGDGSVDVLAVGGADKVTLFPGKAGNDSGHFSAGVDTAVAAPDQSKANAIALLGSGDFDGDGKKDIVFTQSTTAKVNGLPKKGARYVVGYGKADGTFELVDQGIALVDGEGAKKAKWHYVADLDGDGKDDFVYAGSKGEEVVFGGEADRKLKRVATTIAEPSDRMFTYATAGGLVVITESESTLVTFAKADRAVTIEAKPMTAAKNISAAPTDLDGDGVTELTVFGTGADNDTLIVYPRTAGGGATRFPAFKGAKVDYADYGLDLVGDPGKKNGELLFKTDDRKLHAACGYSLSSKEIVAAELPIAMSKKSIVVGTPDLNKDGKSDIVVYDFDAKKMSVFLGGKPSAENPNPQVSYVAEATVTPDDDGGVDGSVVTDDDAGDAGVDGDTTVVVTDDGGADADVDAGDASVTPDTTSSSGSTSGSTSSSGSTSGESSTSSSGSTSGESSTSSGGSSSGKSSSGSSSGKSSSGTPASSTSSGGSAGNNAAPAASDDDGGCSTTGSRSHESPAGSVALGLAVGLMLLGQRRRKQA